MKKITKTKCRLQKTIGILFLWIGINVLGFAQCNPSFTYTTSVSTVSLTSTSTGTTSTTHYNWALSGAANVNYNSYSSTYVFSQLYNGTYTVTLTLDSSSCSGTTSQTFTISGGANAPACTASFTYSVGTSGQVTFTNTSPVDPLNNTSYSWNLGTHGNMYPYSTYNIPSYTYYYNGTYTVTLNASNSEDGCYTSATQTISITNAHPAVSCNSAFTYTLGAAGLVNFTSLYTGTAPGITYNWDFGDGSNNPYGSSTTSHTYAYNGTYNIQVSVRDTATNCDTGSVSPQTFTITNAATQPCTPTVTFRLYQDSINPQPHVWEVGSYYSWQVNNAVWHWGDGTSTAGLSPTHTYSVAGHYSICVTVYSSCGDSATVCQNDSLYRLSQNNSTNNTIISVTVLNVNNNQATGIKTNTQETTQVSLYPNPSVGLFTLQLNNISSTVSKAQISVTNILGEVIYSSQEEINNNTLSKEINLQNAVNGAYFMKVDIDGKTYTSKTIINK